MMALPTGYKALATISAMIAASGTSPAVMVSDDDAEPVKRLYRPLKPKYAASRNSPCPCGSGKKFKRCCIRETEEPR
jgi:uncharacterized protein YecA (UPF0149 family)